MSGWSLVWDYGGVTRVYDVSDVLWTERQDYSGADYFRAVSVDVVPFPDQRPADLADRYPPIGSFARLAFDGVAVFSSRVTACQYGAAGEAVTLDMSESDQDDYGEFPTAAQRKVTDVIKSVVRIKEPDIVKKNGRVIPGRVKYQATRIDDGATTVVDEDLYPTAPGRALGVVIPRVWGEPGTSQLPGSPAVVISTTSAGTVVEKLAISDGRVAASTVTVWGPGTTTGRLRSYAGATVTHETNSNGLTYAVVTFNSPGAWTGLDSAAVDGRWYVSWTDGEARPGDGASVLIEVLEASTLPYDTSSAEALRPFLAPYRIDGYVNEYVVPTEFLERSLAPMLPIVTRRTADGIQVHPWPWRTGESPRAALVEGRSCWRVDRVSYAEPGTVPSGVVSEYCYNPESAITHYERRADPANTASAIAAASRTLNTTGAVERVRLPFTWDPQTASRVAMDRLEQSLARPRRVRYECRAEDHGPVGRKPLRAGMPVTITDADLGWAARQAVVTEITLEPLTVSVTLELRDDPLTAGLV